MSLVYISAIGQDSHRFLTEDETESGRKLILAGIEFEGLPALAGNSDADVILHALTNAISGLTCRPVLGARADKLCALGIIDSKVYLQEALSDLSGIKLLHASFSIEALHPYFADSIVKMRQSIAEVLDLPVDSVAITATSGEGLTAFGRGEGIQCFCIVSAVKTICD